MGLTVPIISVDSEHHNGEQNHVRFRRDQCDSGAMADEHMIEPIDDPNMQVDFWDWADVIGIVDEFEPVDNF